jgi:hypothetical protein
VLNSCIEVSDYNEPYSLCQPLLPSPVSTLGLTRSTPSAFQPRYTSYRPLQATLETLADFLLLLQDSASRGPLGSAILLLSLRARPLASLGAAITILAQRFPQTSQATRSLLSCLFVRLEPIELFVWQGLGGRLDNLLSL